MGTEQILLVDDNRLLLKALQLEYESAGYVVFIADDGLDALEILFEEKINLIVSDVLMPNMDGYYLCYKIRTNKKLKHIPIIIHTATFTSNDEDKIAIDMGADLFIRKPAATEIIIAATRKILDDPDKHIRPVPPARATEMMHQYNGLLIRKLEDRNLELEEAKGNMESMISQLKKAQKIAHLGNWQMNIQSRIVTWSEETYRILGVSQEEAQPSVEYFLSFVHPDDRAMVDKTIEKAVETVRDMFYSCRIIRKDGVIRHVNTEGKFELDQHGKMINFYGIIHDVTEAKVAEDNIKATKAELRKLNSELEERVKQRTSELSDANKELEAFSYTVSHDLRTPVRAIQIFGGLLVKKFKGSNDLTTVEYLGNIMTCTIEMNNLIHDLLEFSKLGRQELEKTIVDMELMAQDIKSSLIPLEGKKKIEIKIGPLVKVEADQRVVKNVWQNLLSNAIKYSKKDVPCKIEVNCTTENSTVIFSVKDNGVGFDMKHYSKLFKPFSRLHVSSEYKGTGAGLAICDRIIKKHGGRIWAESIVNTGSTFYFSLPVLKA